MTTTAAFSALNFTSAILTAHALALLLAPAWTLSTLYHFKLPETAASAAALADLASVKFHLGLAASFQFMVGLVLLTGPRTHARAWTSVLVFLGQAAILFYGSAFVLQVDQVAAVFASLAGIVLVSQLMTNRGPATTTPTSIPASAVRRKFFSLAAFGMEIAAGLGLSVVSVKRNLPEDLNGIVAMCDETVLCMLGCWLALLVVSASQPDEHFFLVDSTTHLALSWVYGRCYTDTSSMTAKLAGMAKVTTTKPKPEKYAEATNKLEAEMESLANVAAAHFGLFIIVLVAWYKQRNK